MQSYISKPVAPVKVQAVQYVAPDGDQVAGNIDELNAVAPTRQQVPWTPATGQNCVLVDVGSSEVLVVNGAYLVQHEDGSLEVVEPEDFLDRYDVVSAAPVAMGSKPDKPAGAGDQS